MAKAKKPSLENAINIFEDVMQRALLSDYYHVNRTLLSKNLKGNSILIVIDQTLWNAIIDKPEIKEKMKELDLTKIDDQENAKICSYGDDLNNDSWIELDCETLYAGKIIKLNIDGLEYNLTINKNLIPLKLKKAEFNNIKYRVFPDTMTLALKKRFDYSIEDHGFDIIRLFKIV